MNVPLRQSIAPAYLFLCILLGGSSQGIWYGAILQLLAIVLIAWAAIERRDEPLPHLTRRLLQLAGLAVALVALQLVPMPPGVWTKLPGHEPVLDGFELLGIESGWMPISLAAYDSIATLMGFLPALGMLAATLVLRAYSAAWLAVALIAGTMTGILLGILQVSSPAPEVSPWYLYPISNFGVATGFFANGNHMAGLLVVTMPFIGALGAWLRDRAEDRRERVAGLALAASGLVAIVLGLVLNRSLAGLGLGLPVLLASLSILFGLPRGMMRGGLVAAAMTGLVAIALLWASPVGARLDGFGAATSVVTRQQILADSLGLAREYAPMGSGLGTYARAYPLHEDPKLVDRYYVNHAHNDYLELVIEMGLPAIVLILLFLCWWVVAVRRMLRAPASDQFAMAGAIASAAMLLHSMVDYPLRTAALGAAFAACLAFVLQSRRSPRGSTDLRTTRHLVIG